MGHTFQVTVDSTSPHVLADWWAETLGWQVEEGDEDFIRSMVAQGHARDADTTTHRGRLVWVAGAAIVDPDGPPGTPRVLFQQVPETKGAKNRVHLDVRVTDDVALVRARLEERGATWLHDGAQGPHTWITMADPEGNEFCVTA